MFKEKIAKVIVQVFGLFRQLIDGDLAERAGRKAPIEVNEEFWVLELTGYSTDSANQRLKGSGGCALTSLLGQIANR